MTPAESPSTVLFQRLALVSAAVVTALAVLGITGLRFGITVLTSIRPDYKPISFSATVYWLILGVILAMLYWKRAAGRARLLMAVVIAVVGIAAATEIPFSIGGSRSFIENLFIGAGNAVAGGQTTPISPAASLMIAVGSVGLLLLILGAALPGMKKRQDASCILGFLVALTGSVFVLSYANGVPLLYGTPYIPTSFTSALSGMFLGIGIIAAAGPDAFPVSLFTGTSIRARLLRRFIPLTVVIILVQNFLLLLFYTRESATSTIVLAITIVAFCIAVSYAVTLVATSVSTRIDEAEQLRRSAEAALGESELRYRSLFENMLEGYAYCRMIYDDRGAPADFIYLEVNRSFDRIIGTTTVTGKRVTEVFPGIREAFPELFEIYGRVARTGVPESLDLDFRPSDKWLHISVYSLEKGFFIAVFEDTTERVRKETALAASEERLRLSQDAANAGTWEWELATNRNVWSEKVWQLYGLDPGKSPASYESWQESIYPPDRADAARIVQEAAAAERPIRAEWRVNLAGEERWLMSRGQPVRDEHGNVAWYRGIVIDITDRKRAEREREILIHDLEQKNAELERFTYTVSHDLKSPLITIQGFLGMLEDDALSGDTGQLKRDIQRITSATTKMQSLLSDLLALSRIGRIANPPENVSFGSIVEEAVEQVAGPVRDRGVILRIQPDLPEVCVDRVRIREVVVNLVENATKFMGDQKEPVIEIGVRRDNGAAVFFVKDNGIGIEPRYREKIFGLFEKLDAGTEGTGVGLAIVRRIIEVHGGKIWVESPGNGRGSVFCFTLPGPHCATDTYKSD